jgi:hypothetical protein
MGVARRREWRCAFLSWDGRETKRHASCGEVCVFREREEGVDLNNEMGAHVYVIGKELSRW